MYIKGHVSIHIDVGGVEIHSIHTIECIYLCTYKRSKNVEGLEDILQISMH